VGTKFLLSASVLLSISACYHEEDKDDPVVSSTHYAVVSTSGGPNDSGDVSIISLDDYSVDNTNFGSGSDTVISTNEDNFYLISRFKTDSVTKFKISDPENFDWQYSSNRPNTNEEKSNPYKLLVKNDTTAYLIRYGHKVISIVDPSASSFENFHTGEIDLSSYAGDDEIPEATDALLIGDKLYVLMQNLDRINGWIVGQAYLAIFDTNDNSEVVTNDDSTTPNGISLIGTNPLQMEYLSTTNSIYIAANGPYFGDNQFSGGVEVVNLSDYSSSIVIDDGTADDHPYGKINNIAILNASRAYFIGYTATEDTAIFSFNPTTGEVDNMALMENEDISDIEIGPLGNLWITNRKNSGITIINTVDNSIFKELIDTDLVPSDIEFISVQSTEISE